MTNATEVTLRITSGPSREELFDALRLCAEGREVEFTLYGEEPVGSVSYPIRHAVKRLQVLCISTQDADGETWELKLGMGKGDDWVFSPHLGGKVTAYYNSRCRRGALSYEKQSS